ncbi:MAG: Gfo/Idh/MocA family oxidoreductase, partial [Chloroflexota bacterium]|nr:Gfo/Idh/MocA family oxidoreductase [Chloroflexota bacterium]
HVHFNKTMTTTAAEATDLIETARAKGLKIVASPGEVLRPQNQQIKRLIEEGALGTVSWVVSGSSFGTYHEDEPERQEANIDPSWYFCKPGGGPLYDMTVYNLHALTTVLGPARRVTAMSGVRVPEREFKGTLVRCDADDNTLILIDFGDGLFALVYGTAAGHVETSYFGTNGTISGRMLNGVPFDYPGRELADQAPGWTGEQYLLPHVVGQHREIEEQHVFEDIMQLVDWVREDKPSPVTAEHARHVIEIIEAGYRAAETGQVQEL